MSKESRGREDSESTACPVAVCLSLFAQGSIKFHFYTPRHNWGVWVSLPYQEWPPTSGYCWTVKSVLSKITALDLKVTKLF